MTDIISFDFAIKYLLKDKGNYDIVEGFISALLQEHGYDPVKIVALLDTESNKEEQIQKNSLADLVVKDQQNHKYIIEIERLEIKNFIHKSCFNSSRLIVDQLQQGEDYLGISKVFHISLLHFKIGNGTIHHGKTIIHEIETKERLAVHIEDEVTKKIYDATEIFPEYIFISIPQFDDQVEKEIDEWLYVMKHDKVKDEFKSPCMRKVAERLNILKMTKEQRDEYFNYIKQSATINNAITTTETKGRVKEKIEIVKNLKKVGVSIEIISQSTGLSKEQIEELEL